MLRIATRTLLGFYGLLALPATSLAGNVDTRSTQEAVAARQEAIEQCYDAALQRKPLLRGKIVVVFRVDREGAVTDAAVRSSSLKDKTMEECVRGEFEKVVLPPITCLEDREEDCLRSITFPFTFSPALEKSPPAK